MMTSESTLLLVDDTPDNLLLLSDLFSDVGYRILCAESGEMALDCANYGDPDLIILDVRMPRMNGFATCRRIKSISKLESIPILFMSAQVSSNIWQEGLAAGGVDFLTKPFCHEEVITRVALHLQLQHLKHSLGRTSHLSRDSTAPPALHT